MNKSYLWDHRIHTRSSAPSQSANRYSGTFREQENIEHVTDVGVCPLQLTCPACSVQDSLVFTITFSFASSFAAMSMLATHC